MYHITQLIIVDLQNLLKIMIILCHLPVCIVAYLIDNFVTKTEIYLKSQVIGAFYYFTMINTIKSL